jgi:hypothetical protein
MNKEEVINEEWGFISKFTKYTKLTRSVEKSKKSINKVVEIFATTGENLEKTVSETPHVLER